jgi:hypothetical protein
MATQNLVDITTLSPKFQDLYAKAKDFIEVYLAKNNVIKGDNCIHASIERVYSC